MTRDAALSMVLARAVDQLEHGLAHLAAGRPSDAEVWIRAARASLASLAILAAGKTEAPRVHVVREGDELPEWMTKTHNGGEK